MKNTEQFIEQNPKGHFMQSEKWGKVKVDWERTVVTSTDSDGNIKGAVAVLVRKLPMLPYTMMYAPRGPVCGIDDADTLNDLTDKINKLAAEKKAYIFKIDPDIEVENTAFIDKMKAAGYKRKHSENFEGIQPNFVVRLDVENKTEDELMASFHSKTRYNIRVAVRKGVEVTVGTREDLPRFTEIMNETGQRDGFVVRSLDYFERMYDALGENVRLYVARHEGNIIAGTLAIQYGDKVWYLYGASSNQARNVMPNYLLQWEMIKWALETNCRIYDFRGVSGDDDPLNPLSGLYRFKSGFCNKRTEFAGEFQIVYKPLIAWLIDKALPVFMNIRKKLFLKK